MEILHGTMEILHGTMGILHGTMGILLAIEVHDAGGEF